MLINYAGVFVVLVWGIIFPVILLWIQRLISPYHPTYAKNLTY
ncbi:MAG: NADH-quinone oxidoreductase subunit A, partial [Peptococcaceae bacterium]|nr:NADH-quinone oxidoreductase subunit A [Peptococcaceae bacterium]